MRVSQRKEFLLGKRSQQKNGAAAQSGEIQVVGNELKGSEKGEMNLFPSFLLPWSARLRHE